MNKVSYALNSEQTSTPDYTLKYLLVTVEAGEYSGIWPEESKNHKTIHKPGARAALLKKIIADKLLGLAKPEHADSTTLEVLAEECQVRAKVKYISTNLPQGHSWQPAADRIHEQLRNLIAGALTRHFDVLQHIRIQNELIGMFADPKPQEANNG